MATGDQSDILGRLRRLLPGGWFSDDSPVLIGLLSGLSRGSAWIYELWSYARLQTRIRTATDGWLDMIAADFFGALLQRQANQSDGSYRAKIVANLFRERATRKAISQVLEEVTGKTPLIFEPQRPFDTGAYGVACGYGAAGGYGSLMLPYQAFVVAFRPTGSGVPMVAGYGIPTGAYSTPSQIEYANQSMTEGVSDADIFAAIDRCKPAGTVIWASVRSPPGVIVPPEPDPLSLMLADIGGADIAYSEHFSL